MQFFFKQSKERNVHLQQISIWLVKFYSGIKYGVKICY